MGELLRRRAELVQSSAGPTPSGALYQLKQGVYTSGVLSGTISGNTIYRLQTGSQGTTGSVYVDGTVAQASSITSTWFQLFSGDVVTLKIKNISGKNNRSTGGMNARVYVNPAVVNLNAQIAQGATTATDKEKTVTLSSNVNVTCLNLTLAGPGEETCDVELWVNDVRYL